MDASRPPDQQVSPDRQGAAENERSPAALSAPARVLLPRAAAAQSPRRVHGADSFDDGSVEEERCETAWYQRKQVGSAQASAPVTHPS